MPGEQKIGTARVTPARGARGTEKIRTKRLKLLNSVQKCSE